MLDLPKWVTDALAQMPALIAVFAAVVVTVRWMDRKAQQILDDHRKQTEERVRLLTKLHDAQIRAKNDRIRALEKAATGKGGAK